MLDGGSGVNSTTEELIVQVFNRAAEEGIPLRDKRHPIIRFEKWEQTEHLRGVAAGKPVRMLDSVVINVTMLELGKSTGPDVWMRFKVCKAGYTDWVGFIIGGRAIDCEARGGLGFHPQDGGHVFAKLGIIMRRIEKPCAPRTENIYPQIAEAE